MSTPGVCRAGAILFLESAHYFILKYGAGFGSRYKQQSRILCSVDSLEINS